MSPAKQEYAQRLRRAEEEGQRRERWTFHLSLARLGIFLVAFATAWGAFVEHLFHPGWILLPLGIFGSLVILHDRQLKLLSRHRRIAAWYRQGLERLAGQWPGTGPDGERYRQADHPYAGDLDLFGHGSLFQRLAGVRTAAGEATLARWLQHGADGATARERQEAVRELTDRLELREALALLGEDVRTGLHPQALTEWGGQPHRPFRRGLHLLAAGSTLLTLTTLIAWLGFGAMVSPFLLAAMAHLILARALHSGAEEVVGQVERPQAELEILAGLLQRIEGEEITSPRLVELQRKLETEGVPPSERIAQLGRLMTLLDARRNQMFAPIAILLFWSFHLAELVERWRSRCGPALGPWLEVAGEMEALAALGGYAYENPEDPFPSILPGEKPHFQGDGIAHPLLPLAEAVANDMALGIGADGAPQLVVISGSNMSGKSTLLRATGVNIVLALMGAPVRAAALELTPLALGASIRVNDSLAEGKSRFYAEITRLRQIVDLCEGERPVLFLLDELLAGTNSHDRRVGAQAVVHSLLQRGAAGMLTTHDLALVEIAESLNQEDPGRALNVHFEDTLQDGELHFDYRLRPGVVERSNALELMRAVGLEVSGKGTPIS